MVKIRIYNFALLFALFCLLFAPILFLQTVTFFSSIKLVIFCLLLAFNTERSITFNIMKVTDQLKWVNDVGLGPIFVLLRGIKWFSVCFVVFYIIEDVNSMNTLACMNFIFISLLVESYFTYVGINFIYVQGAYIPIKVITSIQQNTVNKGKHMSCTEFIIKVDKKVYIVKFDKRMHTGINLFMQLLEKQPLQS